MNEQRQAVIDEVVREIVAELDADTDGVVKHKLSVILRKCGYQKRQMDILRYLERELEHAAIYVRPSLAEARTSEYLRFHREIRGANPSFRLLLHAESELEEMLLDNFDRIPEFANLSKPQRQARFERGTVDILCRDKTTNDFVVIELKAREPNKGTLEQLVDYMREIEKSRAKPANVGVRGILVSGRPDDRIMNDLPAVKYRVDWLCYRVGIEVFAMPGWPTT